ncbi:hypothetical protein QL285_082323 [Trifolium repens]|nr:hypothetical protein QL285_082323 [Trifolium repens]
MSDSAASSQSGMDTQSTIKKGRGCTRMKKLQLMAAREQKQVIDFNSDGHPVGEHAKDFKYHVASLARESVSILKEDWDNVSDDDRAQIWKGLKEVWVIPTNEAFTKQTMMYAAERWKAFKNSLTSRYLFNGIKSNSLAYKDYDFIDEEIWKAFVKSREDPSFLEKRKRGQEAQSHNKHPHRLSQGGYALLHKQMMAEKLKERQDAAGGSQVPPPSPPQRHESWTRARQKPSGEYTSEETRVVAEKISQKQQASYESGYYVMIHMLNIVSASIVDSWTQIFRDSNLFDKDEVKSAQERCAKMILEHIEANACG